MVRHASDLEQASPLAADDPADVLVEPFPDLCRPGLQPGGGSPPTPKPRRGDGKDTSRRVASRRLQRYHAALRDLWEGIG